MRYRDLHVSSRCEVDDVVGTRWVTHGLGLRRTRVYLCCSPEFGSDCGAGEDS